MNRYKLHNGDCIEVMSRMLENSVDAIVTDPPYELGFMGKKWDSTGIAFNTEVWKQALRVLKPGGHLLAFSGSRTYHRMAVAIEDAGFEIRDQIMWIYGSGFPKSLDVAKSIEGKITLGSASWNDWHKLNGELSESKGQGANGLVKLNAEQGNRPSRYASNGHLKLEPTTDEAKQWQGWGTALKPAHEPIVLARKPLIGTVAENVLTYGTGGLNIDGTRVEIAQGDEPSAGNRTATFGNQETISGGDGSGGWKASSGRWPANVIHDGDQQVLDLFPNKAGGGHWAKTKVTGYGEFGGGTSEYFGQGEKDGFGSAARFFYCAKTNKRDRNEGLDGFEEKIVNEITLPGTKGSNSPRAGAGRNGATKNFHPTVKPTDLMAYLCRLVTARGGVILDPFMGSGSTGKAAMYEGFRFIGIEQSAEYLDIAKARIEFALENQ